MELKERFENQHTAPSAEVWNHIENTLNHHATARRWKRWSIAVLAALGVIAGTYMLLRPASAGQPAPTAAALTSSAISQESVGEPVALNNQEPEAAARQTEKTAYSSNNAPSATPTTASQLIAAAPGSAATAKSAATPTLSRAAASQTEALHESAPADIKAIPTSAAAQVTTPERPATVRKSTTSEESSLIIPNAFSPSDPSSEVRIFKPVAFENSHIVSFFMQIYNRSGALVFSTRDINNGWDGKMKGSDMPMGSYVYIIEYKDAATGIHRQKGTVVLIR